jgi:dephospho-CoA kinase
VTHDSHHRHRRQCIGSGKSVVADALRTFGGYVIAADQLGHEALRQSDVKAKAVARWGETVLDAQGNPDRKKIGAIVFADADELRTLESWVFPHIEQKILQEITVARGHSDVKFIVLDAAIMLETGWHRHCDKILFVDAPRDLRLARLKEKRGWDDAEVKRREGMQLPLDDKKVHADFILVNDGEIEKVACQAKDALERWNMI